MAKPAPSARIVSASSGKQTRWPAWAGWLLALALLPVGASAFVGVPNSGRLLSATAPASITVGEPLTITATVQNTTQPFLGNLPSPWNFYGTAPSWIIDIADESWEPTAKVYEYYNYDLVFWGGASDSLAFSLSETNLPPVPGDYAVLVNSFHPYDSDFASIYYIRMTDSPKIVYFSIVNGPVAIRQQPLSQSTFAGSNVVFSVKASGSTDMAYQWRLNGTNLAGATSATLILTNVTPTQAGAYTVRVSNSFNAMTSDPATLTVAAPPVLLSHPTNQVVLGGVTVHFGVSATGGVPMACQWFKGTTALTGETNLTLWLTNVARVHSGSYSVGFSNLDGTATSSNAVLRVLVPQRLRPARLGDGRLQVTFSDHDGGVLSAGDAANFEVQFSTDGRTWTAVTNSITPVSGSFQFEEGDTLPPRRFYRVLER